MREITTYLLLVIIPASLFAEATREEILTPDGTTLILFYPGNSELARRTVVNRTAKQCVLDSIS